MTQRTITQRIRGNKTSDGDGVQLTRIIGSPELNMLDPFLLFDAFGSDRPLDYIGGFPPHPHRGFETVTYMLNGKMRHKDSAGNEGVISAGDVQWMTAGSGIIHSEMPEQERGLLAGFQLWVNLPAHQKMDAPRYQEHKHQAIPVVTLSDHSQQKVIAGTTTSGIKGVINNEVVAPVYWDVNLAINEQFNESIPLDHNGFVYVVSGEVTVGPNAETSLIQGELGVLSSGDAIRVTATKTSQFLVISGRPLNEPVARGGPFVMNTQAEIYQAFADYQAGELIKA